MEGPFDMQRLSHRIRGISALTLGVLLLSACGGGSSANDMDGSPPPPPPAIVSFTSAANAVHVGENTQLTAVFNGDEANIDGIGPVQSGVPVATTALASTTTFRLEVKRGSQHFESQLVIDVSYQDQFRTLAPAPVAYTQHVAVALADGGALVMGGNTSESPNVPDADSSMRFDPLTEIFLPGPQLALTAQAEFTTPVALPAGGLLLVGPGINSALHLEGGFRATQAFDASSGAFHQVGDLALPHDGGGSVTGLDNGEVLVAGGNIPASSAAERYDTATGQWRAAANMNVSRRGHTATRLADARVLIAGGVTCCGTTGDIFTGTAEIYDPRTDVFQPTGSLSTPRGFHAATLLLDGRVLLTGGFVTIQGATTASAEIYDPATGQFTPAGTLQTGRSAHSAIRLTDGRVLVLGGIQATAATDIFDPRTDTWKAGPTAALANASTATLLRNGKVLIFGGENASGFPIAKAMLFE
ncbi:MAG TPA: hypothetical protein VFL16_10540 [Steroidobacteraceae bacterium]|nr:hypothetical protein [Steroidobacteraceae bacterium]